MPETTERLYDRAELTSMHLEVAKKLVQTYGRQKCFVESYYVAVTPQGASLVTPYYIKTPAGSVEISGKNYWYTAL